MSIPLEAIVGLVVLIPLTATVMRAELGVWPTLRGLVEQLVELLVFAFLLVCLLAAVLVADAARRGR